MNSNREIVAHGTSILMIMPGKGLRMNAKKKLGEHGIHELQKGR
jgi:hypothetical protein